MSNEAQTVDAVTVPVEQPQSSVPLLHAEEIEAVIAPKIAGNHNESLLSTRLEAEEVEAVIAPKIAANHNESLLSTRLESEEMEAVIAPKLAANHNEAFLK